MSAAPETPPPIPGGPIPGGPIPGGPIPGEPGPDPTGPDVPTSKDPSAPDPKRPGILPDDHWSKTRDERNAEALEYLRERSRAAGVAEGGSERNAYCMECHGVIPLHYDRRTPKNERPDLVCPHCGSVQEGRVRAMFNWVETDEVPESDLGALLPWILLVAVVLIGGLVVLFVFA